jgi:hypothetical protein
MLQRRLHSALFRALLWVVLLLLVALALNGVGIRFLGDTLAWSRWLSSRRGGFLVWRVLLYAAIACGWWRMRNRIDQDELSPETQMRLRRAEIGAALAILALEGAAALSST